MLQPDMFLPSFLSRSPGLYIILILCHSLILTHASHRTLPGSLLFSPNTNCKFSVFCLLRNQTLKYRVCINCFYTCSPICVCFHWLLSEAMQLLKERLAYNSGATILWQRKEDQQLMLLPEVQYDSLIFSGREIFPA